jgi:hypothetical protein
MFFDNPTYQACICLLVFFFFYTIHLRCKPFLDSFDFKDIDASEDQTLNLKVFAPSNPFKPKRVQKREETKMKKRRRSTYSQIMYNYTISGGGKMSSKYVVDLNLMESILMWCVILILTAGVMFTSGREQQCSLDNDVAARTIMTAACIALIIFSSLYMFGLVVFEVLMSVKFFVKVKKGRKEKGKKKKKRKKKKKQKSQGASADIQTNPMVGMQSMADAVKLSHHPSKLKMELRQEALVDNGIDGIEMTANPMLAQQRSKGLGTMMANNRRKTLRQTGGGKRTRKSLWNRGKNNK